MAIPVFRLREYMLCDFTGRLKEAEPAIRELAAEYPTRPVFRCELAHVYARLGRTDDARREFDDLAKDEVAALPFDMEWLYGISLLAETSALLDDVPAAAILYRLLRPWAAFNVADHPEGMRGSVSRYLGILVTTTKSWDDARAHFEDALEMNDSMGFGPWLARTQEDYARMLLERCQSGDAERANQLFDQALSTYRELGMARPLARAAEAGV
jgi:tetratricopeptide (TPR) repeat protein